MHKIRIQVRLPANKSKQKQTFAIAGLTDSVTTEHIMNLMSSWNLLNIYDANVERENEKCPRNGMLLLVKLELNTTAIHVDMADMMNSTASLYKGTARLLTPMTSASAYERCPIEAVKISRLRNALLHWN